jgi:UDP-glucose 4-epimerase
MRCFVTGAAGFLGSWICKWLLAKGHAVGGLDDFSTGDQVADPDLHVVSCTAQDSHTVVTSNFDILYHCACLPYEGLSVFSPSLVTDSVVMGTLGAFKLALRAGAKTFINFSSMARYGAITAPFSETDRPSPADPYGLAKLCAEQQLNVLGRVHGIKVINLVPHNIIGPGQTYADPYRNVAAIMINRALMGFPPLVYGSGQQVRSFSDVRDLEEPILTAHERLNHSEVLNIGPDCNQTTIEFLAERIISLTGVSGGIKYVPGRPCEVHKAWCSSDKLRRMFNWSPKHDLTQTLLDMIADIKARGPRPFNYKLPIEIHTELTPKTWTEHTI